MRRSVVSLFIAAAHDSKTPLKDHYLLVLHRISP
jgi:hypothetical protein